MVVFMEQLLKRIRLIGGDGRVQKPGAQTCGTRAARTRRAAEITNRENHERGSVPAADQSARCRTRLTVAACRAAGRTRSDQRAPKATCCPTSRVQKRRESYESGYRTIRGRRSLALAVPRLLPLDGLAGEVKPSNHFIETGECVERIVPCFAFRIRIPRIPRRHSWQKICRDARGDRSSNRALIAVVCTSQARRQRRLGLVTDMHCTSLATCSKVKATVDGSGGRRRDRQRSVTDHDAALYRTSGVLEDL